MNTEQLVEFFTANIEDIDSSKKLFSLYLSYLGEFYDKDFFISRLNFIPMTGKIVAIINHHFPDEFSQILYELNQLAMKLEASIRELLNCQVTLDNNIKFDEMVKKPGEVNFVSETIALHSGGAISQTKLNILSAKENVLRLKNICYQSANSIESKLLSLLSVFPRNDESFVFYDIYDPIRSNRSEAERLVREAINLLKEDSSLNEEAKEKIIFHLDKALKSLRSGNNANFYGRINEVVLILTILGNIGSISSGYIAVMDKLKGSSESLAHSSIVNDYSISNSLPSFFNEPSSLPSKNLKNLLPEK